MPWLGLGVWQMKGDAETAACVRTAIEHGYRSIDTASIYGNERGVGDGIRASGVPREEIFVTTKVWNDDMRRDRVGAACRESLQRLGLEYVDLYLLHWPVAGKILPSWRALESLQRSGSAKAIGVSNHMLPHLDELLPQAEVPPAVNQIEFHPYLQSKPLVERCRAAGIEVEAWSPLMRGGNILHDPILKQIASRHGKTVAQIILRWDVQTGIVAIPKSTHAARMAENAAIFDFSLEAAEMEAIAALDRGERNGPDPFNFGF